jgi:tripartite-type tricarboxylate transporter receptor subunit TctC
VTFSKLLSTSLILAVATLSQVSVQADTWPDRPVRIVVPIDAGNTQDALARRIASALTGIWNQPVTVVNQPGASGITGHQAIASAQPDGYTIGLVSATLPGTLGTRKNLPFTKDNFTGIVKFGIQDFIIWVNKDAPINSIQEIISYAKANPEKITYATPGLGSYSHLAMEQLASVEKIKLTHVPYKVFMQAVPDVVAGRVTMTITTSNPGLENQVASGHIKVIGSLTKNAKYQGKPIQTMSSIIPEVHASGFYGIVVAKNIPKSISKKIEKDIITVVSSQDFVEFMSSRGVRYELMQSDDFDKWLASEISRLQQITIQNNIVIN